MATRKSSQGGATVRIRRAKGGNVYRNPDGSTFFENRKTGSQRKLTGPTLTRKETYPRGIPKAGRRKAAAKKTGVRGRKRSGVRGGRRGGGRGNG